METVNAFSVGIVCGDNPALYDCAAVIQRRLSRYRIPKHIRTQYGYLAEIRVFRPGDVWKKWDRLIVIASPDTRSDPFLDACIRRFCQERNQHFIATVTALGDPTEAIPPLLRVNFESGLPMEPLTSDWTNPSRQTASMETTRLMACILSCPFDTLRRRHARFAFQMLAAATAALSLFLMGLALFTLLSSQALNRQTQSVYRNESRYFVTNATAALEAGNGKEAVRYALAALPDGEISRPLLPEALEVMAQVLTRNDAAYLPYAALEHDEKVMDFALSQDQTLLISLTTKQLLLWDLNTQKLILSHTLRNDSGTWVSAKQGDDSVFFLGNHVVYRDYTNTVQCFDLESQTVLWSEKLDSSIQDMAAQGDSVFCLCVSEDENTIADFFHLDAYTGEVTDAFFLYSNEGAIDSTFGDLSFSPDGHYAAVPWIDNQTKKADVILYDLKNNAPFLLSKVLEGNSEISFTEHSIRFTDNSHLLIPDGNGQLIHFDLSGNTTAWVAPSVAGNTNLRVLPVQFISESGQEIPAICCTESDTKYCVLAADTGTRLESGENAAIVEAVERRCKYNKASEPPIWIAGKDTLADKTGISQVDTLYPYAKHYLTERFAVSVLFLSNTICLHVRNSNTPYVISEKKQSIQSHFHEQELILDMSDRYLRIGPEKTLEYTLPTASSYTGVLDDGRILCIEKQSSSDGGSFTFYLLSPDSDTVEARNLILPISNYEIKSRYITGDGIMVVAHELSADASFCYYWNILTDSVQEFPSGQFYSGGDKAHYLFVPDTAEQKGAHVCTYQDGQWTIGEGLEYDGHPAIPNRINRYFVDIIYNARKDQWLIPTAEQGYYLISKAGAVPVEFDVSHFTNGVQNIGFSPDGTQLRIDCMNREIYCFDTTTGKLVDTVSVTPQTYVQVPDGTDWDSADQYVILKGYSSSVAYPVGNLASFVPLHHLSYPVVFHPYRRQYFQRRAFYENEVWYWQCFTRQALSQEAMVSLGKDFIQDGYLIGKPVTTVS